MFISNISAHVQNIAQKAKTDPKSKLIQKACRTRAQWGGLIGHKTQVNIIKMLWINKYWNLN